MYYELLVMWSITEVMYKFGENSYTVGMSGLLYVYTWSLRAEGVYMRQTTRAYVTRVHGWAQATQSLLHEEFYYIVALVLPCCGFEIYACC